MPWCTSPNSSCSSAFQIKMHFSCMMKMSVKGISGYRRCTGWKKREIGKIVQAQYLYNSYEPLCNIKLSFKILIQTLLELICLIVLSRFSLVRFDLVWFQGQVMQEKLFWINALMYLNIISITCFWRHSIFLFTEK